MEKIRISVCEDSGADEHGNQLIGFSRDELIDIKLGIIAKEQDHSAWMPLSTHPATHAV